MNIAGLILVGGRSSRMGRDKASLPAPDGAPGTMLDHQVDTLRSAGCSPVLLAGRADQFSPRPDLTWLVDDPGAPGPLAGLLAGLQACPHPMLAVLAVDMPRFPAQQFTEWHHMTTPGKGAVALGPRGYEPLAAIYPREALPVLRRLLANGHVRLQHHVQSLVESGFLQAYKIEALQSAILTNWNNPDDLSQD